LFRGYKWSDGLITRDLCSRLVREVEDEYEWPVVLWKMLP